MQLGFKIYEIIFLQICGGLAHVDEAVDHAVGCHGHCALKGRGILSVVHVRNHIVAVGVVRHSHAVYLGFHGAVDDSLTV